jgi:predicted transcriptional regulator
MNEKPEAPVVKEKGGARAGKAWEWAKNILTLERKVADLEKRNRELTAQVEKLQEQMIEQTGQLKIMVEFIKSAIDDKVALRAEEAVVRTLERIETLSSPRKPKGRP